MAIWLIRTGAHRDREQKLIYIFEGKIKTTINRVWGNVS